ncbi:hypothetical protein AB0P17_11155 [Streptomyces sp. NPDC088124]|uniref:hypothetical protein n=1 Tax=Streptomyces sp. NPDC088124 TaxID=3154654 RepID=UPI00341E389F
MTMEPAGREPVFAAPMERGDRERVRRAHAAAARQFQVSGSGPKVWGGQGRTLGRRADDCWLRVVSTAPDKVDDQLPPGDVLDKPSARLVLQWPGRTPADALSLSTAGGQRA